MIWQSPEWAASPEESVAVGNAEGVDNVVVGGDSPFSFEESINKLATHHVTLGCNPPDNDRFCPERTLTRGEMASFFARALDL